MLYYYPYIQIIGYVGNVKQASIDDVEASKAISSSRVTKILISASGMATANVRCTIQKPSRPIRAMKIPLAGSQAAGTRGRSLQDGAKEQRIHGDWIPVNAGVAHLDILSTHADADELMHWL
nr:MBL fold metallo-hydrolase RNA specificity domain-containing protein [uncultured Shinella sp.]